MSKKYKVLMVVLMTLLLIISFCSTCFGVSESENISFEIDGKKLILPAVPTLPDLPAGQKYYIIINSESSKLAGSGGTIRYLRMMINVIDSDCSFVDGGKTTRYSAASVTLDRSKYGQDIEDYSASSWSTLGNFNTCNDSPSYYSDYLVYSSMDLYKNGELVFQGPPQQEEGITQILLEETTKAKILDQMKIMIVGFLKYLIALVISVIAFYKAWKFLSKQLKKS